MSLKGYILQALEPSDHSGVLIETFYTNFFQYNALIQNKSTAIEYVTYLDDIKITLRYLHDPSSGFGGYDSVLSKIVQTFQF